MVVCYGMPASIVLECDPWFTSRFWHSLISALGCKYCLSTTFHPETDGLSERMHRSTEQILYCYVFAQQKNWDLLLPMCEFALNSIHSGATGISPTYVVFVCEPTLALDYAMYAVTNGPVQSVTGFIANTEPTLQLVRYAVTRLADYMADYANQYCHEATFAVELYAWLSTDHLKLPTNLSQKPACCYVGSFKVIEYINPIAFHLLLPDSWKVHGVFYVLQLKPAIGFVAGSSGDTPSLFWPLVDDSVEFKVKDILDLCFVHCGCQLVEEFLVK